MTELKGTRREEPLVSVLSLTFNQAGYVEDMMKGFLKQKTTFPVEFIIHDDASTDGTREILERYEQEYPGKFQMVYEEENQWSKGVKITRNILLPRARGKYVAFCEGDDFWIDKNKLQKQADYLEANPDCVCIAHNALMWDCEDNTIEAMDVYDSSRVLTAKDIIDRRHPSMATASKMHRKEMLLLPKLFLECGEVGDMPTDFYTFTKGKMFYTDEIMSVYRYKSKGSWSEKVYNSLTKTITWSVLRCTFLSKYNAYTDGKYAFYISIYMTRSVQNVVDWLERRGIKEEEFLQVFHEAGESLKGHETALEEIRRRVYLLLYGKEENFCAQVKAFKGKKIYLYGAGTYGRLLADFFQSNKLDFQGFVVGNPAANPAELKGKKVIGIEDYAPIKDESVLIIALGSIYWEDVLHTLREHGIDQYINPIIVNPYTSREEMKNYDA